MDKSRIPSYTHSFIKPFPYSRIHQIFRKYDIRGIYGEDLTDEVAYLIGRAFARYLKQVLNKDRIKLSVGRDVRLSSTSLKNALVRGLTDSGVDVVDIGICPTPLQYFSLYRLEVDGGVMITGSHNPPEYNGFKLSIGRETIYGDAIQEIRKIIEDEWKGGRVDAEMRERVDEGMKARVEEFDIIREYIDFMVENFTSFEGLRVVVDSGNGTAGLVAPEIMKRLGAEVIELYSEPDGRFPNHHPDPVVLDYIKDLRETVVREKAHLGIGFDGDADRIGVVDEEGRPVWGDMLMIIFSRDILKQRKGAKIIGEVKCSKVMYDEIEKAGGVAIMYKTGHSLIKKKMKEEGALLAGEMSGHLFFADRYFGYDDAIYASLRLLEILKKSGKPYSLKRLLQDVPRMHSTPEIRFDCPDNIKFNVVERLKTHFKDYPSNTIDGIRINFPDGWALVRPSNTQPALVLRFEASTEGRLREIERMVREKLQSVLQEFLIDS